MASPDIALQKELLVGTFDATPKQKLMDPTVLCHGSVKSDQPVVQQEVQRVFQRLSSSFVLIGPGPKTKCCIPPFLR